MLQNTDETPINYTACCTLADLTHQPTIEAEKIKNAKRGEINFYLCDNIEFMKTKPDKYYDLAIVDPPYGIHDKINNGGRKKVYKGNKFAIMYDEKQWDKNRPTQEYWDELFRVSKNQIVCGANYFAEKLPVSRGWIFWDKMGDGLTVVNNELIYTSFDVSIKTFKRCHGLDKGFMADYKTIHPTQKPTFLYRWLLQNYAKKGDKILDTHGGGMAIAVACDVEGFELDICEIDEDYFKNGIQRLDDHKRQLKLF